MVTNNYTKNLKNASKPNDDFATNLGRFIVARLYEMQNKKDKTSFDKNILMIVVYIVFNISSSQAELIKKWASDFSE
jgi:hypothetical protein